MATWIIEQVTGRDPSKDDTDTSVLWEGDDFEMGKMLYDHVRSFGLLSRFNLVDRETDADMSRPDGVMLAVVRESMSDGPTPRRHVQVSDVDGDVTVYLLPELSSLPVGTQVVVGAQDMVTGVLHLFSRSLTEHFFARPMGPVEV